MVSFNCVFNEVLLLNSNRTSSYTFSLDSIYQIIVDGLFHVQNEQFRIQFRKIFDEKCLSGKQQDTFKDMINGDNPLIQLVLIDKKQDHIKSVLVRNLIELICEKIEMTKEELLNETFYEPSNFTFTYLSLFDESLITLPIHMKIIEQLSPVRKKWEEGFLVTEINKWSTLKENEKQIAFQIWNLVGKYLEKSTHLQQLINEAKAKIKVINKTLENVTKCIQDFCQDASDQRDYLIHLQQLQEQINQTTINSAEISSKVAVLKPFADRIRSLTSSAVWQEYLEGKHLLFLRLTFLTHDLFQSI